MNKRRTALFAFVIFVSVVASGCGYNTLQSKQQNVKAKWANVESALQRRADLIPNLFKAAQAAGIQEQEVFGQIADARSKLLNATSTAPQGTGGDRTPEQKEAIAAANAGLSSALGRLLVLQENYPTLRSQENFLQFQQQLEGTENRIKVARDDYNEAVRDYNTARGSFPTVIAAKLYGFKEEPYFKADPASTQAPQLPDPNSMRRNQGNANAQ